MSVYDTKVLSSNVVGNRAAGIFLEIGARGTVADNLVMDNGGDGVKINNTSSVTDLQQHRGPQRPAAQHRPGPAHAGEHVLRRRPPLPQRPRDDLAVGPVTVRNNVIGLPRRRQLRAVRRGLLAPAHAPRRWA